MRPVSTSFLLLVALPFACARSPVSLDAGMEVRSPPFEDAPTETWPATGEGGTTGRGGEAGDNVPRDAGAAGAYAMSLRSQGVSDASTSAATADDTTKMKKKSAWPPKRWKTSPRATLSVAAAS